VDHKAATEPPPKQEAPGGLDPTTRLRKQLLNLARLLGLRLRCLDWQSTY
jgi:hypothetical protein